MLKTGPIRVKFLADNTKLEDLLLLGLHFSPFGIIPAKFQIHLVLNVSTTRTTVSGIIWQIYTAIFLSLDLALESGRHGRLIRNSDFIRSTASSQAIKHYSLYVFTFPSQGSGG